MTTRQKKYMRLRTALVGVVFGMLFLAVGAKAVYLQILKHSWLSEKAANQYEASLQTEGERGTIYDTRLRPMAVSTDASSVAAYPLRIADRRSAARALASVLELDRKLVYRKLSTDRSFVWIKRQANPKEEEAVRGLNLDGIDFIPEHNRFYPNKTMAAQVIGFSGIDGSGLEGVEYFYNADLSGGTGNFKILKDALGRRFDPDAGRTVSRSGRNLVLTLDRNIQFIAETALEAAVTDYDAASGIAIVMVPKTGAIRALANFPRFNPNAFRKFNQETWRNRAITDPFEPGSTLKIFSAAAALEYGQATKATKFFCESGEYRIGNHVVHDTRPHGWLTLEEVVKFSSNIGAVKIGERIGPETLDRVLRQFGFGEKTGIDCPGETAGSLAHPQAWSKIDAAAIAFGQGISVSAIQLINAVAAIANDGILMKPRIVQAITDRNGRLVKRFSPEPVRRAVSAETARTMRRILHTVTETDGTGINAALDGYAVSGKTGTAQKIDEKGIYAEGKFIASFVGFVPVEKPELAILVVIDEPKKSHYGGVVSAPAFRRIAEEALNYLNIPPPRESDGLTVSLPGEVHG